MRRLIELLFPPKSGSAAIARDRLKIVLAHERVSRDAPDFLPVLQKELLEVVRRYVEVRPDMIRVNLGKSGETSLLEINVELDGSKISLVGAKAVPDKAAASDKPGAAPEKPAAGAAKPAVATDKPAAAKSAPAADNPGAAIMPKFEPGKPAPNPG